MIWLWAAAALAESPAVDAIRRRWGEVQQSLAAGTLVPLRIDANPTQRPWAAVGTFSHVITCHRPIPDEAPYPAAAPVMVTLVHEAAARTHRRTWLYDAAGAVLFVHATGADQPDWRVYWQGPTVVRVQRQDTVLAPGASAAVAAVLGSEGAELQALCTATARRVDAWDELPSEE